MDLSAFRRLKGGWVFLEMAIHMLCEVRVGYHCCRKDEASIKRGVSRDRMWLQFFVAVFIGALMLFVPGYLLMRACRLDRMVAIATAPAISVAGYQVCAIALAKLGIWANWATVSFPVIAIALVAASVSFALSRIAKCEATSLGFASENRRTSDLVARATWMDSWLPDGRTQCIVLAAFVLVSCTVVMFVFVRALDDPSAYQQSYDNLSHLARIKLFVDSGWFAPFGLDMYPDLGDAAPSPSHSSSFYPTGWMCIAAMITDIANTTVAMSENAANSLFMGLVYPVGVCLLGCVLLPKGKWELVLGSALALAFGSYPWGMFNFGPVYPNVAGNAFVPAVVACFILLAKSRCGRQAAGLAIAFIGSSMGMALTHPNAVFAVAVILAPYVVWMGYRYSGKWDFAKRHMLVRILIACLVAGAIALIWWALYSSSIFASVVSFEGWSAFASKKKVVYDLLVFSLRKTHMQPMLALLTYVGVAYTLRHREYLWLTFSLVIAEAMFAVNACTDGFAKSLLTGFWYADAYRVSAVLAMTALPMTFFGIRAILNVILKYAEGSVGEEGASAIKGRHAKGTSDADMVADKSTLSDSDNVRQTSKRDAWAHSPKAAIAMVLFVMIMLGITYCPNVTVPGRGHVETAFGHIVGLTAHNFDTSRMGDVLNPDERVFLQQVKQVVPEGELILNHPYDGSAFAYVGEDMRVYYRFLGVYNSASSENDFSRTIRQRLCDVASDAEVQDAVNKTGAQYLLILDQGDLDTEDHRRHNVTYNSDQWVGIEAITDDTPGFEPVLSEGDMRLYRITAESQ